MDNSTLIFASTLALLGLAALASYLAHKKENKFAEALTVPVIVAVLLLSVAKELLDKAEKKRVEEEQGLREQRISKEREKERANQQRVQEKAQRSLNSLGLQMNWVTGQLKSKPDRINSPEQARSTEGVPIITSSPVPNREKHSSSNPAIPQAEPVLQQAKRIKPAIDPDLLEALKEDGTEINMVEAEIRDNTNLRLCRGKYRIINKFSEPLLLYAIYSGGYNLYPELLISPDAKEITPPIMAGRYDFDMKCSPEPTTYQFYFKTVDNKKFGVISLVPHVGTIISKVISPSNFFLSASGKRLER